MSDSAPVIEGAGAELAELFAGEKRVYLPSRQFFKILRSEVQQKRLAQGRSVKARGILLGVHRLSLGASPAYCLYSAALQYFGIYGRLRQLELKGLESVPRKGPKVYVMKHSGFSDITFHGLAHAFISSGVGMDMPLPELLRDTATIRRAFARMSFCRFIFKENLLGSPLGAHI
ncbi:MAG: hypothetical protein HQL31_07770, partial [Planctomycetes bacterium]|nr:hypothetical protein [Planctomycetota bacterium]